MIYETPSQAFLQAWYEDEAQRNDQTHIYRVPWAQKRRDTLMEYLLPLVSGARVLDIGCGMGMYSLWMVLKGAKYIKGIDVAQSNIASANHAAQSSITKGDLQWSRCFFERASWDEWTTETVYDLVLATEVFEHAVSPGELMQKCAMWGHRLIATCPLEPETPANPWIVQGHLHTFTTEQFVQLVKDAGFDLTVSWSDGMYCYVDAAKSGGI